MWYSSRERVFIVQVFLKDPVLRQNDKGAITKTIINNRTAEETPTDGNEILRE
jgi:hypothetical protein